MAALAGHASEPTIDAMNSRQSTAPAYGRRTGTGAAVADAARIARIRALSAWRAVATVIHLSIAGAGPVVLEYVDANRVHTSPRADPPTIDFRAAIAGAPVAIANRSAGCMTM